MYGLLLIRGHHSTDLTVHVYGMMKNERYLVESANLEEDVLSCEYRGEWRVKLDTHGRFGDHALSPAITSNTQTREPF